MYFFPVKIILSTKKQLTTQKKPPRKRKKSPSQKKRLRKANKRKNLTPKKLYQKKRSTIGKGKSIKIMKKYTRPIQMTHEKIGLQMMIKTSANT